MESFSDPDNLLCCPYFVAVIAAAVVAAAIGTHVEYKLDGNSVHV